MKSEPVGVFLFLPFSATFNRFKPVKTGNWQVAKILFAGKNANPGFGKCRGRSWKIWGRSEKSGQESEARGSSPGRGGAALCTQTRNDKKATKKTTTSKSAKNENARNDNESDEKTSTFFGCD